MVFIRLSLSSAIIAVAFTSRQRKASAFLEKRHTLDRSSGFKQQVEGSVLHIREAVWHNFTSQQWSNTVQQRAERVCLSRLLGRRDRRHNDSISKVLWNRWFPSRTFFGTDQPADFYWFSEFNQRIRSSYSSLTLYWTQCNYRTPTSQDARVAESSERFTALNDLFTSHRVTFHT